MQFAKNVEAASYCTANFAAERGRRSPQPLGRPLPSGAPSCTWCDSAACASTLLQVLAVIGPAASQAPPGSAEAAASDAAHQQFDQPVGSQLRAYEQCGGAGGLCNQTTIGVPCGDLLWRGVTCPDTPEAFSCQRQNSTAWLCLPAPPGSPEFEAAAAKRNRSRSTAGEVMPDGSLRITPEDAAESDEIMNENAGGGPPLGAPGAASNGAAGLGMVPGLGGSSATYMWLAVQAAASVMAVLCL
jgi:hypothetical protein